LAMGTVVINQRGIKELRIWRWRVEQGSNLAGKTRKHLSHPIPRRGETLKLGLICKLLWKNRGGGRSAQVCFLEGELEGSRKKRDL